MKMRIFLALLLLVSGSYAQPPSPTMFDKQNDFDGDGKADFAVTRNEGGLKIWHIWQTTAGYRVQHWGLSSDFSVAGDYDGDAKADLAVARLISTQVPIAMDYYALASGTGSLIQKRVSNFSGAGWIQFPADYDGDGKTDPGLWAGEGLGGRISYRSTRTDEILGVNIPVTQLVTRLGDFDGDGTAEIASTTFNPPTVHWTNPSNGNSASIQWGLDGDRNVPADFDGDGKGDVTIFRPSTGDWWWLRSSDNLVNVLHWGANGDIPAPADYDGDGRTDPAVVRRLSPNSIYYFYGTTSGPQQFIWGLPSDGLILY